MFQLNRFSCSSEVDIAARSTFIMKIAIVVLFGMCTTSFGKSRTLPSKTDFTFEDGSTAANYTNRAVPYLKHAEETVDLSNKNKLNETEIYENGQTAKTDHERAFIYLKNVKSKLPWYGSRGSLFDDDFGKAINILDNDYYEKIPNFKVNRRPGIGRYFDHNFAYHYIQAHTNSSQSNYHDNSVTFNVNRKVEPKIKDYSQAAFVPPKIHRTPHWSVNWDWQHNFNVKLPIKKYYFNEELKVPVESKTETYSEKQKPHKFGNQRDNDLSPPHTPKPNDLQHDERYNTNNKLYNYNDHIKSQDNSEINNNKFNCYNRECKSKEMNHDRMNNGIRSGSQCMCPNTPIFYIAVQTQDYKTWKKHLTENEKSFIRSVKANEMEPYAALLKETKKLTSIVDKMER